jgi:hypothetical protein
MRSSPARYGVESSTSLGDQRPTTPTATGRRLEDSVPIDANENVRHKRARSLQQQEQGDDGTALHLAFFKLIFLLLPFVCLSTTSCIM